MNRKDKRLPLHNFPLRAVSKDLPRLVRVGSSEGFLVHCDQVCDRVYSVWRAHAGEALHGLLFTKANAVSCGIFLQELSDDNMAAALRAAQQLGQCEPSQCWLQVSMSGQADYIVPAYGGG